MDQTKTYFNYVEKVLGVKSVLIEQDSEASELKTTVRLMVFVEGLQSFSEGENELLQKMLATLKLAPEQMLISDLADQLILKTRFQSDFSLIFQEVPTEKNSADSFVTYSPRLLLVKSELKKPAWDVLQKLIRSLGA